jgi:Domain of unknown function (DU1801)
MIETNNLNNEVTLFLDKLQHPLRAEIEILRKTVIIANNRITENIKWNGPNYIFDGSDRITMRINPPKQIQLVFHRGAKVLEQPKDKLIKDNSGLLIWKTNDRAIVSFKDLEAIKLNFLPLTKIINKWLEVKV